MAFVINGDPSTWQALRPSPRHGKNGKGGEGAWVGGGRTGGEGIAATDGGQMEVFVMLFNYTCKFERLLSVEAQETGPLFFFKFLTLKRFLDGSSVTTNALRGHDTNIQFTRGAAPGILSVTLL